MIGLFKRWKARRQKEAQLRICRAEGHQMTWNGTDMAQSAKLVGGVPVADGPATDWILKCKCGYGELVPVGTEPYVRPFEEGLAMLNNQGDLNAKGS